MNTQTGSRAPFLILFIAIMITRGSSFIFSKVLLETMSEYNLIALRFLTGFIILAIIFFKKLKKITRRGLLYGVILGLLSFLMLAMECYTLKFTDASVTSFLEHTAIVMIPIIESIVTRKLPKLLVIICDIVTIIGIGFLSFTGTGFKFGLGEILCLIIAVTFAVMVILTNRFSLKEEPIAMGIVEIGVTGVLALIFAFLFESPRLPASGSEWLYLLLLAILCTSFGFAMQPLAQSRFSASAAGLLIAVNPLSAAILSSIILHETFTVYNILGGILILAGIIAMYVVPMIKNKESF